jgi:hypothetical protein
MKKTILILTTLFFVMGMAITSCSTDDEGGGMGEGAEGNHMENGNEQGESGTVWSINDTADEIVNGIRTIITFNAATNAFEGTLENLNTNVAQQTRLEVHIIDANDNATEFGPTPGVDMQPGATRNISLPISAGVTFVEFTMHTEVGAAGSGG